MKNKPFYITTTLPYVNADPHIGFAMEIIRADVIARAAKLSGREVFLNTGTDEHGLKIYRAAGQRHIEPQAYADEYAAKFRELIPALGIMSEANFIRTTDAHHVAAAQEFWKLVDKNGFIYKKDYSVKYCAGCELEKTESELVDGRCPLHPLQELEAISEENYFFKFSAFGKKLLELYADPKRPNFVVPDSRLHEIRSFVERGLEDFSISRLKDKMPWGIPVPGDDKHVMYVWFDALVNYIAAVGWPDKKADFKKWWEESDGVVQYCGKDNLRQQAAMWQAMLMAAGLPASQTIVVDGFVTGDGGVKMSKSLGNTVNPFDVVKEYGTDALRYYVVRELQPFEDSPFSMEKFKEAYNAHLANGLGNLVSRVMKMANSNLDGPVKPKKVTPPADYTKAVETFNLHAAANVVWQEIAAADLIIQEKAPFKLVKTDPAAAKEIISDLCQRVYTIAVLLEPILPQTSATIQKLVSENAMPAQPLFARKE